MGVDVVAIRLHSGTPELAENTSAVSAGDGGWIMQQCAQSLGGTVGIRFEETQTVFTLTCPSRAAYMPAEAMASSSSVAADGSGGDAHASSSSSSYSFENSDGGAWSLPPGVWGIAIDDSAMQRKLLRKLFQYAGVADDHIIISGGTAAECFDFAAHTASHVR
jgi:hypothetical protein